MMTLSASTPLFATAMYSASAAASGAARSPCASPATSTDSLGDDAARASVVSPTTTSKLPGLQFAISHRRANLCLPLLGPGRAFDSPRSENVAMSTNHHHHHPHHHHPHALYLSMPHCETPHYMSGVPVCPEASPLEKKSPAADLDAHGKKRKKGTRRGTLNAEAKNVLKAWMFSPEHFAHPYPSEEEKEELALEAGIEVKQLSNWFTNARKRLWQPVLRQSGVEVKNFLSTGRGGPRGNKLDVPANLQHLIAQKEAEDEDSPPSSPCASVVDVDEPTADSTRVSSLKRAWSEMHSSPAPSLSTSSVSAKADEVVPKKKKIAQRKRGKKTAEDADEDAAALTTTASQLSHELRVALDNHMVSAAPPPAEPCLTKFKDIEILAAASLIGLHHQPFQPVH